MVTRPRFSWCSTFSHQHQYWVRFNNLNATAGFVRRTVSPHNVDYIHLLIRGDTSGEVEKVEHDAHIVPGLSSRCVLKVDSGFTHGERVLTL